MKKTINLIAAAVACAAALSLNSCQKRYCWKCMTKTIVQSSPSGSVNTGYHSDTTRNSSSVCDKTAAQIKDYEKSDITVRTQANVIVTTTVATTCEK